MARTELGEDRGQRRGRAVSGAWTVRQLTEAERAVIRTRWISDHRTPNTYVRNVTLIAAGAAILTALLFSVIVLGHDSVVMVATTTPAFFAVYMAVAWIWNRERFHKAMRRRRRRTPRWVWVIPAEVRHGRTADGELLVRCQVREIVQATQVTREQLEWLPEGTARVEMLPGRESQTVYRYLFPTYGVQVYPDVRRFDLGQGTPLDAGLDVTEHAVTRQRSSTRRRHSTGKRRFKSYAERRRLWESVKVRVAFAAAAIVIAATIAVAVFHN